MIGFVFGLCDLFSPFFFKGLCKINSSKFGCVNEINANLCSLTVPVNVVLGFVSRTIQLIFVSFTS